MLILSRKVNEKIMIGDDIAISIIEIKGDQIRIGIDAPRSVKVFRQEVLAEIKAANKAASESGADLLALDMAVAPFANRPERKKTSRIRGEV
ncbi:MAG: carbon storage regulator CsrA [Treponema sp.]|jgi:carbon storage regulator|nr:carbon storage regulator CsrA [Treponema sp.]